MSPKLNLWIGLAVALLVLIVNGAYVVDQRAVAVLLEFGKFERAVPEPGLHFKLPFAQTVWKMDKRLLTGSQTATIPTGDQKELNADYYVKWRIADVATYYRATGGQAQLAGDRLMTAVDRSLRDVFGGHSVEQIASGNRDQLDDALLRQTRQNAGELGIEVVDVRIRNLSLPREVAEAYYDRMRAERKRLADDLRARGKDEAEQIHAAADSEAQTTLAEGYRKAEALRGEGDGKAAEIYSRAYGQDPEFYAFYRSLAAYREAFHNKRDVLVVEPRGEFFKYFKDAGGAR